MIFRTLIGAASVAIGAGRPDGDLTAFNDIPGVDPAFALTGDLIAGHDSADQLKACRARGGTEMLRKLMDAPSPGVHLAACIRLRQHVDRLDRKLVARDKAKGDLTIIDWTQSERDKFRQVAKGAREDFAREVSESHARSMKHAGLL